MLCTPGESEAGVGCVLLNESPLLLRHLVSLVSSLGALSLSSLSRDLRSHSPRPPPGRSGPRASVSPSFDKTLLFCKILCYYSSGLAWQCLGDTMITASGVQCPVTRCDHQTNIVIRISTCPGLLRLYDNTST